MILSGISIAQRPGIIQPFFEEKQISHGMSYGLSHCGYDVRLSAEMASEMMTHGSFMLAVTEEHFMMPNDLCAFVMDKSTLARRGIAVQNTIIEPGWHGYLTLEITCHGFEPVMLEPGMPIAQIVFHQIDQPVAGYDGKYQAQAKVPTLAKQEP